MRRAIADGILTDLDNPRIIVGRNRADGNFLFPIADHRDKDLEEVHLEGAGTIWSFTVQRFRPKTPPYAGPDAFAPFAVGYVSFPCGAIIQGRFTNVDPEALTIGQSVEITTETIGIGDDGADLVSYAFQPAGAK